jgi:hypothetical protein
MMTTQATRQQEHAVTSCQGSSAATALVGGCWPVMRVEQVKMGVMTRFLQPQRHMMGCRRRASRCSGVDAVG